MHPVATPERLLALVAAVGVDRVEVDFGLDKDGYRRFVDTLDSLAWLSADCVRRVERGKYSTPWEQLTIAGLTISSPLGCTPVSDRFTSAQPVSRLAARTLHVVEPPEPFVTPTTSGWHGGDVA